MRENMCKINVNCNNFNAVNVIYNIVCTLKQQFQKCLNFYGPRSNDQATMHSGENYKKKDIRNDAS